MEDRLVSNLLYAYMDGFVSMARMAGLSVDTNNKVAETSYPFIPKSSVELAKVLINVERYLYKSGIKHDPTFLDAGCGIGNVMLVAREIGFDVSGIDLNPDLIEMAHCLLNSDSSLDIADILSYNKYDMFDVIYYFHPLCDVELERQFEKKVENDAKEGTIILAAMKRDKTIEKDSRFKRLIRLEPKSSLIRIYKKCENTRTR